MKQVLLFAAILISVQATAQNTSYGTGALPTATNTGIGNSAFGDRALNANTSGRFNTAVGGEALKSNTVGLHNLANGLQALFSNTSGNFNIAIGNQSLYTNSTGSYNTGIGGATLYYNTTGIYNTACGYRALFNNTTANGNTATGYYALVANTTGEWNTAAGVSALSSNNTGYNNSAFGVNALVYNTSGSDNSAMGRDAMQDNSTGNANVAFGTSSLQHNTAGSGNTANGRASLQYTTGNNNTGIGLNALTTNTSGDGNTAIGAYANVASGNLSNATAIGYGAVATQSNQIRFGNNQVTSIGGAASWTTSSDRRLKTDIKQNVPGLTFINLLNPVTYQLIKQPGAIITGFIAQEVEQAAKEVSYDFSGVDKPKTEDGMYGLRYSDFVVPLVRAVQELSKQNEALQKQINDLQGHYPSDAYKFIGSELEQNTPNPFDGSTAITYTLPQHFTTAQIVITDAVGRIVSHSNLSGSGTLKVDARTLAAGAYNYSLIVDGQSVGTKRMALVK